MGKSHRRQVVRNSTEGFFRLMQKEIITKKIIVITWNNSRIDEMCVCVTGTGFWFNSVDDVIHQSPKWKPVEK